MEASLTRAWRQSARHRVVVTGLGMVTPLGSTTSSSWSALLRGETGVAARSLEGGGAAANVTVWAPAKISAEEISSAIKQNPSLQSPRFISLAMVSALEAVRSAGFASPEALAAARGDETAVAWGNSMGAATSEIPEIFKTLQVSGERRVSPYFVPKLLPNMAAGHLSIRFGARGPVLAPATACASGAHAIGEAFRLIERGDARLAICGGSEATLDPMSFVGFQRLKALCGGVPDAAVESWSRPFDARRAGFVMGEGAGCLVLESLSSALERGVEIYAEVLGFGASGDAYHATSPSPDGVGAERCMRAALRDAGETRADYVNAHATSTPAGDGVEAAAIARVFEKNNNEDQKTAPPLIVSSTKGATGHLLGAAGAVEAAFCVLAAKHGVAPGTTNLHELDPELAALEPKLEFVRKATALPETKPGRRRVTMSNSFGFGGTNASVVFASAT